MPQQKYKQGDIVWLDCDPKAGHEQGKRRPAVIVSGNSALNLIQSLAFVCPISSSTRDFPTHVVLDDRTETQGQIMCEQTKALDLDARNASFIESVPADLLAETLDILRCIFD